MQGEKLDLVKQAVRFIIDEMTPADRLSLVTFNSDAERKLPLNKMDGAGKDGATQAMMRLTAGGGTQILGGLECGVAVMEQRRQRNPVGAILLLTDGRNNSPIP